jgi:DNA sulfur modification protein DndC
MTRNIDDLFADGAVRLNMDEAIELTAMSLRAHGANHDHWAIAYSGGKDSSATLTLVMHLITSRTFALR